ncbi:MAG: sulfatase-like hydrolase/transferase [Deltaproteobacteria bacterium]|nr:sulfatase-like hydrolase/transferase [Deltaproteobacteria bacterium]
MADAALRPRAALLRYADALLCGAALVVAEALVVGVVAREQLAGAYEVALAMLWLVPMGVVAVAAVALGGVLLVVGVEQAERRQGRVIASLLAAGLAGATAVGVSGGRLLAGGRRPLFVAAVVIAAAAIAWWGAPLVQRGLTVLRARGAGWLILGVAVVLAGIELLNGLVLPRLYPAFHQGLAVLTLWLAALASTAWSAPSAPATPRSGRARLWGGLGLLALCALVGLVAPSQLRFYDNIRLVYLDHGPLLSHVLRLGALVAPPPPLDDGGALTVQRRGGRSIDFRGRDVVLITVDALRADHVGAYGYGRATTPVLDELAREGALFEAVYTPTPHTSYAICSLMTGKYMRPLMRQGIASDSPTLADAVRRYEYRTAAFFPPAAFFIDRELFTHFEQTGLGFEYRKVQFTPAAEMAGLVQSYLEDQPSEQRQLLWVHLFEPHEPYETHRDHDFGDRDIDRYDGEIAAADAAIGALVGQIRRARPRSVVLVTADHGEEFGEHGGRYHGTTVYDEQVRVPLIVHAPGLVSPMRISEPVSLVDILPTVLTALDIPVSPRVRGRDLGPLLAGAAAGDGFAFSETNDQTLLARGALRLVCARRIGACRLYDVSADPQQQSDVSSDHVEPLSDMKRTMGRFLSSLGRYEAGGEDGHWPRALRRGIGGDAEAVLDVAALLDDANVAVRRKAAEVLFDLRQEHAGPHLRRALRSDEDDTVRSWCALALTRLGQGAPLVLDLIQSKENHWRRLAALTLAEAGDDRGEAILLSWWRKAYPRDLADRTETMPFERAKEVVAALVHIKSEAAVGPLTWALADVRLRVPVAQALARLGDEAARPALGRALAEERYHDARGALARALVALDGGAELRAPLIRFLGVPDPMAQGLAIALQADVLRFVGGPRQVELRRLRDYGTSVVAVGLVVPEGGNGRGLRVIVRARTTDGQGGQVHVGILPGPALNEGDGAQLVPKRLPRMDPESGVTLDFAAGDHFVERHATLPQAVGQEVEPASYTNLVVYATQNVELSAAAVVPLADELPPPPPEPWEPADEP